MKVYSDNGSNFVGAQRELQELYQLLQQKKTQDRIHHWASERQIEWHFSPSMQSSTFRGTLGGRGEVYEETVTEGSWHPSPDL